MSFFTYDVRVPDDTLKLPEREYTPDEIDAMLVPLDKRDRCVNNYVEFKKCIMTTHQHTNPWSWVKHDRSRCGYYFDHWNHCRELMYSDIGYSTSMTGQ